MAKPATVTLADRLLVIPRSNVLFRKYSSVAGPRRTRIGSLRRGTLRGRVTRALSTINDLRAAEKRLQEILDAIQRSQTRDLARLSAELLEVTDDYTRVVGELRF